MGAASASVPFREQKFRWKRRNIPELRHTHTRVWHDSVNNVANWAMNPNNGQRIHIDSQSPNNTATIRWSNLNMIQTHTHARTALCHVTNFQLLRTKDCGGRYALISSIVPESPQRCCLCCDLEVSPLRSRTSTMPLSPPSRVLRPADIRRTFRLPHFFLEALRIDIQIPDSTRPWWTYTERL